MATWTTSKTYQLSAALRLPGHSGKLGQMHGHSYSVTVMCERNVLIEAGAHRGMLSEEGILDEAWETIAERLDHQLLNEIPGLENPTAENLAKHIFGLLFPLVDYLAEVKISESPVSCATYRA